MSDSPYTTPPPAAPTPPPMPMGAPVSGRPGPASDTSKILAALGYPIPIIALIAILIDPYKDEKFVKFHGYQALALAVVMIIAGVIAVIPVIGWIIWLVAWIAWIVFVILGLINAFQGKYYEIPLLYGFLKTYIGE
jgi:uncharacterized membrane protein